VNRVAGGQGGNSWSRESSSSWNSGDNREIGGGGRSGGGGVTHETNYEYSYNSNSNSGRGYQGGRQQQHQGRQQQQGVSLHSHTNIPFAKSETRRVRVFLSWLIGPNKETHYLLLLLLNSATV
jgi:hypothetical protein